MPKVAVLPEYIASQIAAGEVVERPSSVIKELVENSLDAGATRIEVSVSSDLRDMRVADNGSGMEPEDAVLAFQRHATSKITSAHDLSFLTTLGFRGEALPSIASISKFTCYTRPQGSASGTRIDIKDGLVEASETGCSHGTVMEINDLFYNVPARLKFLKKGSTEFGHVQEIVQSLAIAHPKVAFELKKNDSLIFRTSGSGSISTAALESKLFTGKESLIEAGSASAFAEMEEFFEAKNGGGESGSLAILGVLAKPLHFRGDRKAILSIVNKRPVRCPLTYKALEYAYSDLIPRGRYPLAVIKMVIDPEQIDVNIHPSKKEIKYVDSNGIYMALYRAISEALRQPRREMISMYSQEREVSAQVHASSAQGREIAARDREIANHQRDHQTSEQALQLYSRGEWEDNSAPPHEAHASLLKESVDGIVAPREALHGRQAALAQASSFFESQQTQVERANVRQLSFTGDLDFRPGMSEEPKLPGYIARSSTPEPSRLNLTETDITLPVGWRLAGYIHNTYFLFETPAGIEIIEQHIAHERTLYERILAGQASPGRISEDAQRLCISVPLDLSAEQRELLQQYRQPLQKLGFEFEFDKSDVSCTQVPLELAHQNYATIVQRMLDDLAEVEVANVELEATKSLACQSAIKNGMPLSERDILQLVCAWLKTPRHDTCPHGRPVRLSFSKDQLFQMFHPA